MPKFEANMNYISPPGSMKQCNKSATVKFHMELLLTTTSRKQSRSGATPVCNAAYFRLCIDQMHILAPVTAEGFDNSHHPRFTE